MPNTEERVMDKLTGGDNYTFTLSKPQKNTPDTFQTILTNPKLKGIPCGAPGDANNGMTINFAKSGINPSQLTFDISSGWTFDSPAITFSNGVGIASSNAKSTTMFVEDVVDCFQFTFHCITPSGEKLSCDPRISIVRP